MNVLIYGKRKQGKSTLALSLAVTFHQRVVVFDPNNQFPILQAYPTSQELARAVAEFSERDGNAYFFGRVGPFSTEEIPEQFAEFATTFQEFSHLSVIVDEAHLLQGSAWLDPNLDRWNRRSPKSVALIQTTHRIVDAHPDSRYHADDVFFFYAYLPREIKTIRENFGEDVSIAVQGLGPHQLIHWTKATGGHPIWYVWPNGEEWFIDLENENDA